MQNEQIWRIRPIAWDRMSENEMSRRISLILQKWIPFADKQFGEWSTRPNSGHFFGGAYWYGLETAFTASVFAMLAKLPSYDEQVTGVAQVEVKRKAIAAIRYLGFTHDTGPDDCVRAEGRNKFCSLQKWGGRGQGFFAASQTGVTIASFGIAAWLLWDDLDDETRSLVQNVVSYYADRWCEEEPRNGVYHDTQAEENAWTAGGIVPALMMFPDHPRHEAWLKGFENWSINAVSTTADRIAESGTYVGTPQRRVRTVTFHPDFTTENHGFAHPSYICAGINLRGMQAVYALMGGQEVSDTVLYNSEQLYERTVKIWAQFDGLAVPIQGQDWWYNRQHERQFTHAFMNVLHGNRDAARLERGALTTIERLQASNPLGCMLEENGEQCIITGYQTAKDMENISAKDLLSSCLLHLFGGVGAPPAEPAELAERLSGVYVYPYGCSVIHRTPNSFSSFSWRSNVMALTLPANGCWTVTPLPASYIGSVKFADDTVRNVNAQQWRVFKSDRENVRNYGDGFGVTAALLRGDRELMHDVAFVSLPGGSTVYAERFHILKACAIAEIQSGTIGIRNELYPGMPDLSPGSRTIRFSDGSSDTFAGFYGREPDATKDYPAADWLNLDDQVGYILFGSKGVRYVNKHEYPKWKGVEDILVLNRRAGVAYSGPRTLEPFVAVTLPNRTADETASLAGETRLLRSAADVIVLETAGQLATVNFGTDGRHVQAVRTLDTARVYLYEGGNRIGSGEYAWSGRLEGFAAGYKVSDWTLEADRLDSLDLDVAVLPDRLFVTNRGQETAAVRLRRKDGTAFPLTLAAGATEPVQVENQA